MCPSKTSSPTIRRTIATTRIRLGALVAASVLALVVGLVGDGVATAQVVTVRADAACDRCRIVLSDTISLTAMPADVENALVRNMVRDPESGMLFVLFDRVPATVYVFDAGGSYLRSLEPQDDNPDSHFVTIGLDLEGRLHVVDRSGGDTGERIVLSRLTGETIERHGVELARYVWDIAFGQSKYVASGAIATRETAGYPLHVYDERGRWQTSFGVSEPAFRGELRTLLLRWVTSADSSTFWAAPLNEYRLEKWTFEGRRLQELVGDRAWFGTWVSRPVVRSLDRPPEPFFAGLTSDGSRRLWVLVGVPAPRWHEALDTLRDRMGNRLIRPGGRYQDSVLELVDPVEGSLVASMRLQGSWSGFSDSRHLWRTWIDADGKAHTIVVAFGLIQE